MFSDPEAIAIVTGLGLGTCLVTWLVAGLASVRLMDRHRWLAVALGVGAAPLCMLAYGIAVMVVDGARHPHDDLPAMALAGSIMISMFMPVITVPLTMAILRRARRGRDRT